MTEKTKVGIIGWRGMVGSVLIDRMLEENDFKEFTPTFFSTSQHGMPAPKIGLDLPILADAYDLAQLGKMDIILTAQGGEYTKKVFDKLRVQGWQGYWLDAASTLRMIDKSIIILDPVNYQHILNSLQTGVKNFIGGNCTVSLLLMALSGLFKEDAIDWISTMTYQAISGSGAKAMSELLAQNNFLLGNIDPNTNILDIERQIREKTKDDYFPKSTITQPLAMNLLPWIDVPVAHGQTREEWKGYAEINKILATKHNIPIDGICVRTPTLRSHSQAITIQLKNDLTIDDITQLIASSNKWVKVIENNKTDTLKNLTPMAVSGSLDIAVGRIRKTNISNKHISLFTVGDQLLWGAAEPLRRMLRILLDYLKS